MTRWLLALACAGLLCSGPAALAKVPPKAAKRGKVALVRKARDAGPQRKNAPKPSSAKPKRPSRFLEAPAESVVLQSPAFRYANLTNAAAYAELDRRALPYARLSEGPSGVRAPVRLTGTLHGVAVHSALPPGERASSVYEVLDARLALALDDFCALLERHEIVELVHYTMYRPGASPRADSDLLPTRHPGGLAIDVGALRKRDGTWLDVGQQWQSDIGKKTCGPGAKKQTGARAEELVGIVCETADSRLFHYMLTPHYNAAHHDHVHLEIKPGVRWFLVN